MSSYNPLKRNCSTTSNNSNSSGNNARVEDGRRVFVGFLPIAFSERDIRKIFEPFGYITKVKSLNVNTSTYGRCVIEFEKVWEARNCYDATNGVFKFPGQPRPILVKIVTSEKQLARAAEDVSATPYSFEVGTGTCTNADCSNNNSDENNINCNNSNSNSNSSNSSSNGSNLSAVDLMDSSTQTELSILKELELITSYKVPPVGVKIFVGSIPYSMTDVELRELFGQYGTVINTMVNESPDGRSKGSGFVWFASLAGAQRAVEALNGKVLFKSYSAALTVRVSDELKKALAKARDAERERSAMDRMHMRKLYVKGLPRDCDDEFLKDVFSRFGRVVSAVVAVDRESGLRKDYGFVCYEDGACAKAAMTELDGLALPTGDHLQVQYQKNKKLS